MSDGWNGSFLIDRDGREHAYHLASDRYAPVADVPMVVGPPERLANRPCPRRPAPTALGNPTAYGINFYQDWPRFEFASVLYNTICAPAEIFTRPEAPIDPDRDWYYLTASNGAARGVEAYLSYWHVRNPEFWVYDWSIPEGDAEPQEHGPIVFEDLRPYWQTVETDAGPLLGLSVVNATTSIAEDNTRWRNTVLLYRPGSASEEARFDRVYTRDYDATIDEQRRDGSRVHDWGPILESGTAAQQYETNPAGFTDVALLLDADITYLSPSNTFRRGDDPAACIVHLRPNHALVVALRP